MRSTFRRRRITSGLLQKENASAPSGLGPVAKAHRGFGGVHGLRTTIRAHPSTATATAPSPRCETLGTTCAPHTGIDNLRPVHTGSKATYAALPPRRTPAAVLVSVLGLVTSLLLGTATHTDAATPPAQSVPIHPQQPYQPPPPGQGVLPPHAGIIIRPTRLSGYPVALPAGPRPDAARGRRTIPSVGAERLRPQLTLKPARA